MDILKQISLILFCFLNFGCEQKYNISQRDTIDFDQWDNKPLPKTVVIETYDKKSNFKNIIKIDTSIHSYIYDNQLHLSFKSKDFFSKDRNYIILLNDEKYKISDIYPWYDTVKAGTFRWRISTHIDSFKVNGKMYRTDFIIPKEARIK